MDLQILLFNNRVYGLTKGQHSPTSLQGMRTKSSPQGSIDHAIDPIAFALASMARPHFPAPIGVIRAVEQPTYEAVLQEQIDEAIAARSRQSGRATSRGPRRPRSLFTETGAEAIG